MNKPEFEYDIGLSFASEQRGYVERVAEELNQSQGGNYILQRWQRRGSFHHQCVGSGL